MTTDSDKCYCLASVSKEGVAAGLHANEWVGVVTKIIGGKGGGKSEAAKATGENVNVDLALRGAVEYAGVFFK